MTDKQIIRNAHCKYFEGQSGLCLAKEFTRCNPIKCKLYIIDELSTIKDLQEQLQRKEQECKLLKASLKDINIIALVEENERLKQKVQDNETFYLKKYANKDSECLELQHKVNELETSLENIMHIVHHREALKKTPDTFDDLILNEIKEALNEN